MTIDRRAVLAAGACFLVAPRLALARGVMNRLVIATRSGQRHEFALELANTAETRARGLMFRRDLADGRGMLFDFGPAETEVSMWMKNTYIPLDMMFIRADGTIRHIAENTTPLSEALISSTGPVKGVLEVAGGTAARLGLSAGDLVEHPFFGT
ncbi:DUF192 domain-containing protein [Phreatobacter stygius]|uniref:DUF192 domain-containing protein n=1 Tax=Phreatobacter stygius TaxID=1940610 RepID=A0A4D7BGI0_9HYPH|nr:DUF192 domain-containing protein [Phreatobacter stygius]QCI68858.1 DUF192 domain-containing protein [Phreatobacter stygius]